MHEIRLSVDKGRWQARVVTLPNHTWVEPGGRRALVFEAGSPERATEQAAAFIQRDCVARGHRVVDPMKSNEKSNARDNARRRPARHPVRFMPRASPANKTRRTARIASTENLSETGLFIATERPLPPGSRIEIDLRLLEPSFAYRAMIQTLG